MLKLGICVGFDNIYMEKSKGGKKKIMFFSLIVVGCEFNFTLIKLLI